MPEKLTLNTHVYLIGPRGAGKSHVGRLLAKKLNVASYDVDALVKKNSGQSITRIVQKEGWPAFRKMEHDTLTNLSASEQSAVIATGGGVVLDEDNRRVMRDSGLVVYLKAPFEVLLARVCRASSDHRPALTNLPLDQEMAQMLREREPLYQSTAVTIVDASLPAKDVADAILKLISGHKS